MPMSVSPLLTAPQVTGHPHGLPEPSSDRGDRTRVTPIADARDPQARLKDGQVPTQFWRAVNGEPDPSNHTAPPSIMQITISRMLDEQAPRQDAAGKGDPEGAKTGADPTTPPPAPRSDRSATGMEAETTTRAAQTAGPSDPATASASENRARRSVFSTLP